MRSEGLFFCCHGCRAVHELLVANGLGHFYDLRPQAGLRIRQSEGPERFQFLDDPEVRGRLLDFQDETVARVTLSVPAMHCVACVWLLENLFRLREGIGRSQVNFARREVTILFDPRVVALSGVVALLDSIGYTPTLRLDAVERGAGRGTDLRRLHLQVGIAGFAFGNTMLFSFPAYLGLGGGDGAGFRLFFGLLSLLLSIPVLVYSAADYWRAAWTSLRQRRVIIELPIALGLAALFGQSAWEILGRTGEGYLDSLTGLVFFLLCGRVFQRKTFERLAFDRDYRSFFPLSVMRRTGVGEETVPISRLAVGDRLRLRHGELIPADARLVTGEGWIDYSFVTGEAEPVEKRPGDHLYAGGRQTGGVIEVETVKPVSQSYLTSLWDHEAFRKPRGDSLDTLTNRFSRWFVLAVILVAVAAGGWWWTRDPGLAVRSFTAVLIVACPCALALSAPFATGTAQRRLARAGIFLKRAQVVETLARIRAVVFDKTGTLTLPRAGAVTFEGPPLTEEERRCVSALTQQSTHPHARSIGGSLGRLGPLPEVAGFAEMPGLGMTARVGGREVAMGGGAWLAARGVRVPADRTSTGSEVCLAVDGVWRGRFRLAGVVRPAVAGLVDALSSRHDLMMLSGDNEQDRDRFRVVFGPKAALHFNQDPLDKLAFIRRLQSAGHRVMMVGDGLNDAGALQQSDVGVAVVEELGTFSPASDAILEGDRLDRLPALLGYARATVGVVKLSFLVSCLYNVVGISLAARGLLAPWICAILMPVSSVSVVALATGATTWLARRAGLTPLGREELRSDPGWEAEGRR